MRQFPWCTPQQTTKESLCVKQTRQRAKLFSDFHTQVSERESSTFIHLHPHSHIHTSCMHTCVHTHIHTHRSDFLGPKYFFKSSSFYASTTHKGQPHHPSQCPPLPGAPLAMSTFTEHYNLRCLARRSQPGAPLPPTIPSG